jgi:uncharacterized protein YecE (DUF72 family)
VDNLAEIRLGTSSFTAAGWEGSFYPKGIKSADRLSFYAEHFDTVEIDSTFYACPSPRTVEGWNEQNSRGLHLLGKGAADHHPREGVGRLRFRVKAIRGHDGHPRQKLGPMVLQFPFFSRGAFKSQSDFLDRLIPFLKKLPKGYMFAVEIRNREWLDAQFAGVLRDFGR